MSEDKKSELEILLEIAQTAPVATDISPLSDVKRFVIDTDMRSGPFKVQASFIYELYKKWKKYKDFESLQKFCTNLSKIFQKKRVKGMMYYYIDIDSIDLNDEILNQFPNAIIRPRGYSNVKEDKKDETGSD